VSSEVFFNDALYLFNDAVYYRWHPVATYLMYAFLQKRMAITPWGIMSPSAAFLLQSHG
jgi:hypothetical protein